MPGDELDAALERLQFLSRAESRVRIVERLLDAGPSSRRDLRERLDVSRTTVSRALRSLVEEGWVEHADEGYRLTHVGRLVATEIGRTLDRVGTVEELSEFLQWFPDGVDLPPLLDATDVSVTYSTDAAPYAPARKQTAILHEAEGIRLLLPATDLDSTETVSREVIERGLDLETVASPAVESTFESEPFAPLIREMLGTDRSTLYVAPETPPFYLGLTDAGAVQIGLADDEGLPRALLETTDDGVVAWTEEIYRDYRADARRQPIEAFR